MSLHKDIILGEIAGKNAAIHAYDKILWMIRSGYMTLFYGGWAVVLKSMIENGGGFTDYKGILVIMFAITLSLAIGAYLVDKNYLRRKFRVIFSLNILLEYAFKIQDEEAIDKTILDTLHTHLKVSGDADNTNYDTDGYKQAIFAENAIYIISVLSLLAALLYVF